MNIPPQPPESADILKAIGPVIEPLYSAIEAGVQSARELFDSRGAPIDPYHGPSHVRWEAKRLLQQQGQDVADVGYDMAEIPNNGLRLTYGSYVIWILKTNNGRLPGPGPSQIRRKFYTQCTFDFLDEDEKKDSEPPLALVVLWGVTEKFRLRPLRLVCPEAGDVTRKSVRAYWSVRIPHPALSVEHGGVAPEPVDDLDIWPEEPEADAGNASV